MRTPARRTGNKPDKVIADVNHVGPYFLLRFIMEKRICVPINLWVAFDLVSACKSGRLSSAQEQPRAISPSRSPGSALAKAQYSERCAGYSCARDNAVVPACRGRHWRV